MVKKLFVCFTLFFLGLIHLQAAPFKFLQTEVVQVDGSVLNLYASGDEFYNWLHDIDGYTILQGEDGFYYYAIKNNDGVLVSSTYRVDKYLGQETGIQSWLKISTDEYLKRREYYEVPQTRAPIVSYAAHRGVLNNIVIFISFKDVATFSKARSVYDSRFNTSNTGSLKHYYSEVSYGNLVIDSHFFPEAASTSKEDGYVDFHNRGYYMPYNASTNPDGYRTSEESTSREHSLICNAIDAVRSAIENQFTPDELDNDGDGLIDNVCFVVQGNSGGWSDLLWAHRWSLYTRESYIHGKRVYDYVFQPENQVVVKTLCHEMFHALGAPDLYHYNEGANYDPVGNWDLMNNGGGHMTAYMKWRYAGQKWVEELPLITTSGTYELSPLSQEPSCYKVNSTNPNEYFVLEYRTKDGMYEKNLDRAGVLIYRINTTVTQGNRNGPPDELYIYRPYGTLEVDGYIAQAAYRPASGAIMNDKTFPRPFLSDNSDGGLRISNIVSDNGKMKFDIDITTTGLIDSSLQKEMRITVTNKELLVEGVDIIDEIVVFNTSGNICQRVSDSNTISLASLPEGVYIVNVMSNKTVYKEKIIVR